MRNSLWAALLALMVALVVAGCGSGDSSSSTGSTSGGSSGSSSSGTIKWDMIVPVPPSQTGFSVTNFVEDFAREVKERTNGQLQITVRPPGELPYTADQTLATVGGGKVEMGDTAAFIAAESKVGALPQLPYLVQSPEEFYRILPDLQTALQPDLDRFGAALLASYSYPVQTLWGRGDAPSSLRDLSGKDVRASSPEQAYLLRRLGANPVSLVSADVATSVQRGVVDAITTSGFNAFGAGWSFLQWGYLSPVNDVPGFWVVNRKALDGLPEDVRSTLQDVAQEYQDKMESAIPDLESRGLDGLKSQGTKLVDGNDGDIALGTSIMSPYWDTWASDNNLTDLMDKVKQSLGR